MPRSQPRPLPVGLAAVRVGGLAWFADRRGEFFAFPAETVVPVDALFPPLAREGQYAFLALPAGDVPVDGRTLPYRPLPIDEVFPLGRAEVPWNPEQRQGAVLLGRDWRLLLRERDAFRPWGEPPGAGGAPPQSWSAAWEAYNRRHGPRPTFRAGADRRQVRLIYPQLLPPFLCHRLGPGYLRAADRLAYGPLVAEGPEFRLTGADGRTATVGADPLGWRVVVHGQGDPETARQPEQAAALLARTGPFWTLAVQPGGSRLISASGAHLLR